MYGPSNMHPPSAFALGFATIGTACGLLLAGCHAADRPRPSVAKPSAVQAAGPDPGAMLQESSSPTHAVDGFRAGMIGKWNGVQSSEWEPSHPVELTFEASGNYHATCLEPGCTAFFWGNDQDDSAKTWRLERVERNGAASGLLWVTYGPQRSPEKGTLSHVALSEDGSYLQFEFWGPEGISTSCFGRAAAVPAGRLSFRLDRVDR